MARTPKQAPVMDAMGRPCCPCCSRPDHKVFIRLVPCNGTLRERAIGCANSVWDKQAKCTRNPITGGSGCPYLHWLSSGFVATPEVVRAPGWPQMKNRTAEQCSLRSALALNPKQAGRSRCIITNAVPGSGKSSSMADDMEVIALRSIVDQWFTVAFNVHSKESLLAKTPAAWPNIQTINGFGGRIQNFSRNNYKVGKIGIIFRELIVAIEPKKRPSSAGIKAFSDRIRDLLLTNDNSNPGAWTEAIETTLARFPGLDVVYQKNAETIKEYIPQVLTQSMSQRTVIDLTEQYCRPALLAIQATGWKQRPSLCDRSHIWTTDDCEHICKLVRAITMKQCAGIIVDEAQDLSLSQIVLFLAATYRAGELILVGDDKDGEPGEPGYKAGQAIFGWRGAFPTSLKLVARLWQHLTGETPEQMPLSQTFRCPPEVCDALRPLNSVMKSTKPYGFGEVAQVSGPVAFQRWLEIPETNRDGQRFTALWLTRRNAPLAELFMCTLREHKEVCLRGGKDLEGAIDAALSEPAGWRDETTGEYRVSLPECLARLRAIVSEQENPEDGGAVNNADSMEAFLLEIGENLTAEPELLKLASDKDGRALSGLTVGNLRRFVLHFANKSAPRVLSTVYRSKGDESDLVIVDDVVSLNMAWNNDTDESAACRHVACSRTRQSLLTVGVLDGVIYPPANGLQSVTANATKPTPALPAAKSAEVKPITTGATLKPITLLGATARKPRTTKPKPKTGGTLFSEE